MCSVWELCITLTRWLPFPLTRSNISKFILFSHIASLAIHKHFVTLDGLIRIPVYAKFTSCFKCVQPTIIMPQKCHDNYLNFIRNKMGTVIKYNDVLAKNTGTVFTFTNKKLHDFMCNSNLFTKFNNFSHNTNNARCNFTSNCTV